MNPEVQKAELAAHNASIMTYSDSAKRRYFKEGFIAGAEWKHSAYADLTSFEFPVDAEKILSKHSKNYAKTVDKDEKTLYHLQLNGFEAINAMKEYAVQSIAQCQSSQPKEEQKHKIVEIMQADENDGLYAGIEEDQEKLWNEIHDSIEKWATEKQEYLNEVIDRLKEKYHITLKQ